MQFRSLPGLIPYEEARRLQHQLVEERAIDQIPDTVLFLEHFPVITRGRGLQWTGADRPKQMPVPLGLPPEIGFCETERGGDLTYHGPGQLVIYPIVKLDGSGLGPKRDVAGFLRKLERVLIAVLLDLGLKAEARENATGIWIGERKLASIGIAVRKWVTYHGVAINGVNDLSPFHLISPCGFSPEVMTRLQDFFEPGQAPWEKRQVGWRADLEERFKKVLKRWGPPF